MLIIYTYYIALQIFLSFVQWAARKKYNSFCETKMYQTKQSKMFDLPHLLLLYSLMIFPFTLKWNMAPLDVLWFDVNDIWLQVSVASSDTDVHFYSLNLSWRFWKGYILIYMFNSAHSHWLSNVSTLKRLFWRQGRASLCLI